MVAQLLIWIHERVEVIDVEEVELEEWGRHPGVLVLSSSHQMLPGELQGTDWGRGLRVGSCCSKQRWGPMAEDRSWLPVRQLAVNNRLQFPGRGRQVRVSW